MAVALYMMGAASISLGCGMGLSGADTCPEPDVRTRAKEPQNLKGAPWPLGDNTALMSLQYLYTVLYNQWASASHGV